MSNETDKCPSWTVIVVTAPNRENAYAFDFVLRQRQRYGLIDPSTIILTVDDPQDRLGSGGATLNALLVATEYLSAKTGYSLVNTNVLHSAHILILHAARTFPYDACHRALATLPARFSSTRPWLLTNLDILLYDLCRIIKNRQIPFGVWVCSTDAFITLPIDGISIPCQTDIHAFSALETVDYASNHGIYVIDKKTNVVKNMFYRSSVEDLKKYAYTDDQVPIVSGIVYFSVNFADKLLNFHAIPPLDGCTYQGVDSGSQPNQLSLYFDFLLATCLDISFEQYLSFNPYKVSNDLIRQSKTFLWSQLNGKTKFTCEILPAPSSHCQYIDATWPYVRQDNIHQNRQDLHWSSVQHSMLPREMTEMQDLSIVNSIVDDECHLGKNVSIYNSILGKRVTLGNNSAVKSVDFSESNNYLTIPPDLIVQRIILSLQTNTESLTNCLDVYTVLGTHDGVNVTFTDKRFTIFNRTWKDFQEKTGVDIWDLWPDLQDCPEKRTLANAHLYPVLHFNTVSSFKDDILWFFNPTSELKQRWKSAWRLSLDEILVRADVHKEILRRQSLFHKISQEKILQLLLLHGTKHNITDSYLALVKQAVTDGFGQDILDTLDRACLIHHDQLQILPCLFSAIANTLAEMAGGDRVGLRSGPYLNREWQYALSMFEDGQYRVGIQHLIKQRQSWMNRTDLLIRAARHYDGATQTLIKQGVLTCRSKSMIDYNVKSTFKHRQITVECPVRLDLSGGWTDTPPICYEHGGNVLNVAITINNQRPIGARASLLESNSNPVVIFVLKGEQEKDDKIYELNSLAQFTDYNQPQRAGALLKTCCIFTGIVDVSPSQELTLAEQLQKTLLGHSLKLEAWSNVPVGSGLGTSSILAGAILLALWNLIGIENVSDSTVIHGVLVVEQMMTTGGGWQDQIGGLLPAFKLATSKGHLPLTVDWRQLNVSENRNISFWDDFDQRIILVYTGQTRLARNLLQSVLRNWYSGILSQVFDELEDNALRAAEAVERGDLEQLGRCMSTYWHQKLLVAPGSEPETCRRLIDLLTPYIYGVTLAGAGGGGFLAALAKTPHDAKVCQQLINKENIPNVSLFTAAIDRLGPSITFA